MHLLKIYAENESPDNTSSRIREMKASPYHLNEFAYQLFSIDTEHFMVCFSKAIYAYVLLAVYKQKYSNCFIYNFI